MVNQEIKEKIMGIIEKYQREKEKLVMILLEVQKLTDRNYIDMEWAKLIAEELKIPYTKVYDVITFYSMFSIKPRGKYVIEICKSAPCHVNKSKDVVKEFEEILNIKMGETTPDNLFTLQYTSCIGACDVAPAIKIGEKVYGNLNKEKIQQIVMDYRNNSI
ncbi:NADP-reducing hydrogenase subunit HndA [Caloramator mitchellensis]|uniref:NADP-reducing hydrogenase subunit HndA n=1 Tax=Caloramator mitchellensis TaxID=908809 RepID=A0A0R3K1K8_CALMK|nr:NAD(P)H-dependent oxidoreductase subunit E [Caloramator mitchellensis]KRQ87406.1 NADP-reducing hydrogenase subunit HndA [Caloramator mitchellensis]